MRDAYVIAKYIRLSDADGDLSAEKEESNSIGNQREYLQKYIDTHPDFNGATVIEFCDDGRSGTNFDRPGVREMLERAKRGEINCIIVKDLSRFGRDYIEVGDYLEQIFPFLGIRFIAVNDDYDSIRYQYGSAGLIDVSFKNVIYDLYSKELSGKVRGTKAQLAQKGYSLAPYGFFGYKKADGNKHQLVIDEKAARIVRDIFERFLKGQTAREIAQTLNRNAVPTPLMMKRSKNITRKWNCVDQNKNLWTDTMVRKLLLDERYTGKAIFGKTQRKHIGKTQTAPVPKEKWIVVDKAFEAVISQETFDKVQVLLPKGRSYTAPSASSYNPIFYRKLKCGICRMAMTRAKRKRSFYFCETYRHKPDAECADIRMDERQLSKIVLAAIRKQAQLMRKVSASLDRKNQALQQKNLPMMEKIEKIRVSIARWEHDKMQAFEEMASDRFSEQEYRKKCFDCNEHIQDAQLQISQIETSFRKVEINEAETLPKSLLPYTNVRTLTRELVDELVSAIYIYSNEAIEIVWTFQDEYMKLMEQLSAKREKP